MSHYYYFAATLPTLQLGGTAPMTSAEFLERAGRYVSGRELDALRAAVLLSPPAGAPAECLGVSPLLDGYYAWERAFRFALARIRAARLGRPAAANGPDEAYETEAQARFASQAANPLEGELAVEGERWVAIESFLGYDEFGFEALAAYRLKLQSLERAAALTAERGEAGYRTAYDAILGAANTIDLRGEIR